MSRPNGKVKMECAHDKTVPLNELKEHHGNPNKHYHSVFAAVVICGPPFDHAVYTSYALL